MTTDWGANPAYRLQQQSVPLVPRFVELPFSTRGSTESPGHRTPANSLFVLRTQRRVRRRFSSPPFRVPMPKRSNRGAQSKFGAYSAEIPRYVPRADQKQWSAIRNSDCHNWAVAKIDFWTKLVNTCCCCSISPIFCRLQKQLGVAILQRRLMILQHFPGLHRVKLLIRA